MARPARALAIMAALVVHPAIGAEIDRLRVTHDDGTFRIVLEARLNASAQAVYAALTDYDHLDRLSPGVVASSRVAEAPPDEVWVRTVTEGCVAFFCRELERVIRVQAHPGLRLTTRVLPDRSDFRSGRARLRVIPEDSGARLEYRARMTPDVWIPPIIGPWQVKRNVRWHYREMVSRLERPGSEVDREALPDQPHSAPKKGGDPPDPLGARTP